jgi:hypothetical protein
MHRRQDDSNYYLVPCGRPFSSADATIHCSTLNWMIRRHRSYHSVTRKMKKDQLGRIQYL